LAAIEKLVRERTADLTALAEAIHTLRQQSLDAHLPARDAGQMLSLIAAFGELAATYGIARWPRGEAIRAARDCFRRWLVIAEPVAPSGAPPAPCREAPAYPLGAVAWWWGQSYELIDIKPYRDDGGSETLLLVWRSSCFDCDAWFNVTTPNRRLKSPSRRCELHKRPTRGADATVGVNGGSASPVTDNSTHTPTPRPRLVHPTKESTDGSVDIDSL
jgi:hypothetical protein